MKKYDGYAVITGGSGGLGLAFAKELAAGGYDLVLVARDEAKLEGVAEDIRAKYSVDVITISQDLSKIGSTDIIFYALQARNIDVGLLINNVGFAKLAYFHEIDRQYHLDTINAFCLSRVDLTYRFLPAMLARKSGGVIFVSGLGAQVPAFLSAVYFASEAFSVKLGVNLHAEYDKQGVDFLVLCPGNMDTTLLSSDVRPTKSLLAPHDVAKQALKAIGKDIVLTITNDVSQKILLSLMKFTPLKIAEKLGKKFMKMTMNIDVQ